MIQIVQQTNMCNHQYQSHTNCYGQWYPWTCTCQCPWCGRPYSYYPWGQWDRRRKDRRQIWCKAEPGAAAQTQKFFNRRKAS